jgi:hypothetical protein
MAAPPSREQETDLLHTQAQSLQSALKDIQSRLEELEGKGIEKE